MFSLQVLSHEQLECQGDALVVGRQAVVHAEAVRAEVAFEWKKVEPPAVFQVALLPDVGQLHWM